MFQIRKKQIDEMVIANRDWLINDIEEHLLEHRPDIVIAYPRPYFRWVVNDSIDIALESGIDDVSMLRVFVRLRWEISPGFYKQPQIARVLSNTKISAEDRFENLASEEYADAWSDAQGYDSPMEWRARFWIDEK